MSVTISDKIIFKQYSLLCYIISDKHVQHSAAEDGGGAVEEGGQHQENLSVPGCGGYQGESRLPIISSS